MSTKKGSCNLSIAPGGDRQLPRHWQVPADVQAERPSLGRVAGLVLYKKTAISGSVNRLAS
jgi:hypothetical protein